MMQIKKEYATSGVPIWQSKNTQVAQGGFLLDDSAYATEGTVVPAGIPIGFDEATRKAKVCKFGIAQADATDAATTYKVEKGHNLAVGMTVISGAAAAGKEITAIDTESEDYDELTLEATLGVAIAKGDTIQVADDGYNKLKGLLYSAAVVNSNGVADIAVVLRGTVYERRIMALSAAVKAKLPHIIFSQSF